MTSILEHARPLLRALCLDRLIRTLVWLNKLTEEVFELAHELLLPDLISHIPELTLYQLREPTFNLGFDHSTDTKIFAFDSPLE